MEYSRLIRIVLIIYKTLATLFKRKISQSLLLTKTSSPHINTNPSSTSLSHANYNISEEVQRNKPKPNSVRSQQDMTEEFDTAGVCTRTWWNSFNGMFSGCSLPRSAEIFDDIGGFEWKNIDTLDAKTYNESHNNTSTFIGDTNIDSTSRIYVSNQSNV